MMARGARRFHPRAIVRSLLRIDDTPHAIALGTSLGMLIGLTPTIGIQVIAAALICTLLRANRVAAIITVFVSNPLTFVPIYWADYWLGAHLLGVDTISRSDFAAIWQRIADAGMIGGIREAFAVLTGEIFLPMMLGGTLIGIAVALPLYPLTYRAIEARRRRRELRRAYLRLREERAAAAAVTASPSASPSAAGTTPAAAEERPAAPGLRVPPEREESLR